jgi:hypothetical protein
MQAVAIAKAEGSAAFIIPDREVHWVVIHPIAFGSDAKNGNQGIPA